MSTRASSNAGFSLTELSAIVASITVLVAIGAPAASRLSDFQRTTLCLNRIGQMTRAFLAYSQDYGGVFPFTSTMQEPGASGPNEIETWLANWGPYGSPQARTAINTIAHSAEANWPAEPNVPCSGTLFAYARSPDIFRCPEFERVSDPNKAHNVFNYTRAIWARRWLLSMETPHPEDGVDFRGPILQVSNIHKPDDLPMLLDEQWDRHVATSGVYGYGDSAYNCNDYGFSLDNVIGVYHGAPVVSDLHRNDFRTGYSPFLWKQGSVGYYDGHAGLKRDPWPTFELGNNRRTPLPGRAFRLSSLGARSWDETNALYSYVRRLIFSQRGISPSYIGIVW